MDLTALGDGLLEVFAKLVEVAAVNDTNALALFLQRRQGATPDHIIDGDVNAKENFVASLKVDDTDHIRMIEAEEIGEVAVLTVDISIVGIVERSLVIGREESDAF